MIAGILATIMAGLYNVDQFRAGIDDLEPLSYVSIGYYRRWLHTLEVNCVNAGVFSPEELEARIAEIAAGAPLPVRDDPRLEQALRELIEQGASNAAPSSMSRASARAIASVAGGFRDARHVRIPGYAQGKVGTVHVVHEAFVFPDTNLRERGREPRARLRRALPRARPVAGRRRGCERPRRPVGELPGGGRMRMSETSHELCGAARPCDRVAADREGLPDRGGRGLRRLGVRARHRADARRQSRRPCLDRPGVQVPAARQRLRGGEGARHRRASSART